MVGAYGLEDTEHAYGIDVGSELGCIEADLHMALSCKVVNFGWLHFTNELDERHGVGHVGIVEVEMGCAFKMSDTFAEIHRRPTDDAMDFVTFSKEEFREVATVLSGNTGDEGDVLCHNIYI